jgi:hypothetical protein
MLEQKLIDQVIDGWVFDQNFPTRNRKKKPVPNRNDVKEILDQAFLASLKREEDRPISFTLTFLNKEDVDDETKSTGYHQIIVIFDEELPFSVEAISKIASAFDPKISALIVGKSKENGKFSIWGGMFFGPTPSFFNHISVEIYGSVFSRPDVFTVTAKHAGSLTISRGNVQIGAISSGIFVRATPIPFISKGLGGHIEKIIQPLHGYQTFNVEFYRIYIDCLDYLLLQSSERGHGSIIVILPNMIRQDSSLPLASKCPFLESKYSFFEKLGIEKLIYETVNNSKNFTMYH